MIFSWLAVMKVSPSQARPRIPMMAVIPDWQVLHLGTSATGARVTVRMSAATASMTIAIAIGIPTTTAPSVLPGTVLSVGKMPAKTMSVIPPKNIKVLALAPRFNESGWTMPLCSLDA